MTRPVIQAIRNEDILVNIEGLGQPLSVDIQVIVVAIGTVMKLDAEGSLPMLRLQHVAGIGSMQDIALEIQFPYATPFRPPLEIGDVVAHTVSALQEPHFRIEVPADVTPLRI